MIRLPSGSILMGSGKFYPEERPVREAAVGPFWIDESPVTNGQFRDFVAGATGPHRAPAAEQGHLNVAHRVQVHRAGAGAAGASAAPCLGAA
jgi:formylglycine-generating enzyme